MGCTKKPDLTTINITHTEPTVHLLLFKVFVEIGENFSAVTYGDASETFFPVHVDLRK